MEGGWASRLWRALASRATFRWIAGTIVVLAVGGFLFAWSGLYSVAASGGHWPITEGFIKFALQSSVRTNSIGVEEAPPLGDPDLVRLGAGHFAGGCAPCHGAPGSPRNAIARAMAPPPPPLDGAAKKWKTEELFWIVRHGIIATGMPAWTSVEREDEVWAVVAFLRRLPELSAEEYRALANAASDAGERAQTTAGGRATFSEALIECGRCHGDERSPPISRLVPRLSGQSGRYLAAALRDYAEGTRFSGVMQPVASELDDDAIKRLSAYYAGLAPVGGTAPQSASLESIARGGRIAADGVPQARIPPCLACHAQTANAAFPRLHGQPAPYLITQLRLWKNDARGHSTTSLIMKPIAERLADDQIEDVAAYFESLSLRSAEQAAAPRRSDP